MSPEAKLRQLIDRADRLLPGEPAPEGKSDPRWQAIMRIEDYVEDQPALIWPFVEKWGKHPQEDTRSAIAVLLLENLLRHHFALTFPRVRAATGDGPLFRDTLRRCG